MNRRAPAPRLLPLWPLVAGLLLLASAAPAEAALDDELGRNEVRVLSAPYPLRVGVSPLAAELPTRLERLGYTRVRRRPETAGEYFWGHERFWIFRRRHRWDGDEHAARLIGLELDAAGRVAAIVDGDGELIPPSGTWLEPEVLAESLVERRARRRPIDLELLPEHVWQPLLAAEDARFFEHSGVDAKGIARALIANVRAGKVVQGGSTITQQLIKTRDLSPKRSFMRKASEALRALELEAEYDKREILEAYLNHVYYGHLDGVAVYGIGAAARAFFSKPAAELGLAEAAVLAAMVQGPNRLSPARNPQANRRRQLWVLERMQELGWASAAEVRAARGDRLPPLALDPPAPRGDRQLVAWIADVVEKEAPRRFEERRGFVVETTFDPLLQAAAGDAIERGLDRLRREHRRLRGRPLSAALLTIDARSGEVLAAVAGDPADPDDAFDRVRQAQRQSGSLIKPLVLLEAFADCGDEPLYPARRVADRPLRLELPSGAWEPSNFTPDFRGAVTLREALVDSLNVPFVRVARRCGFEATADRVQAAGVRLPDPAPPSFVLGAVETSPLALARAYSVFANGGDGVRPSPVRRIARPTGGRLASGRNGERRVADPVSAYLVLDLLRDAVARGTATGAALDGAIAWGKTGTSDDRRDAWFVGGAGHLLTVVWVGNDDSTPLGLTGSQAAVPLWKELMQTTVGSYPPAEIERPSRVVERWVQEGTGLRVGRPRRDARLDLFRRGDEPPKRRLLRDDEPLPVLE